MNLKESFRYQNYLDNLITRGRLYLDNRMHVIEVKQIHKKSAANPDATDEVLTTDQIYPLRGVHYDVNRVVCFLLALENEKEMLGVAISRAKRDADFQLDAEIALNKTRQSIAATLKALAGIRPVTKVNKGSAYRFNAEGNQVAYTYDVVEEQLLEFDQTEIRKLSRMMMNKADDVSNQAECCLLNTQVDFYPMYNVNDTFEEAIETYLDNNPNDVFPVI